MCPGCGQTDPAEFHKCASRSNGRQGLCKRCCYLSQIKRQGWTPEYYGKARDEQKDGCAICHRVTKLVADHDHLTGYSRGLLCHDCNAGLGFFKDNPFLLRAAVQYLSQYGDLTKVNYEILVQGFIRRHKETA